MRTQRPAYATRAQSSNIPGSTNAPANTCIAKTRLTILSAKQIAMGDYVHYQNVALDVEQVPLANIAAQFGTPCYVYSHAALTDNLRQFTNALQGRKHLICYAVKANSNLAILNVFARLGAGFDIVSGGELQRVLAAGGEARKVVFSGVGKTVAEMRMALDAGILCFNVESAAELDRLNDCLLYTSPSPRD